jgi:FkbM family methyltransferase
LSIIKRLIRWIKQGKYNGLNQLDSQLEKYVDYDGGYFVELGANDGVAQSNSLYFEKYRGWRGLLVEPSPHNFIKCRKNRSSLSSIHCAACVAFDYDSEFVRMAYSNLMSTALSLDSDILDPQAHAELGQQFLQGSELLFEYGAVARRLNDLLRESNAPKIVDFLSLDVEGAELEVLRGIDFKEYHFKYILVECRDFDRMEKYLSQQGYCFLKKLSVHDYLFAPKMQSELLQEGRI